MAKVSTDEPWRVGDVVERAGEVREITRVRTSGYTWKDPRFGAVTPDWKANSYRTEGRGDPLMLPASGWVLKHRPAEPPRTQTVGRKRASEQARRADRGTPAPAARVSRTEQVRQRLEGDRRAYELHLAGRTYEEIGAEFGVGAAMARVRVARYAATLGQTRPRGRPRQMDRARDP